jgi:hypothetical protein
MTGYKRGGVQDAEIRRANTTDPTPLLESMGFRVAWEGRHGYISRNGVKAYRITLMEDGRYVSRPNRGDDKIGDNIALVRHANPSLSFREALTALLGREPTSQEEAEPSRCEAPRHGRRPVFPPEADRQGGRSYLIETRRISHMVLDAAELDGAVHYGQGNVAFCGYDESRQLRNVSLRSTGPLTPHESRTWSLSNSDKAWPTILAGDPGVVWVVEGGVDGLAIQTLYHRAGRPWPTAIVSGGIKVLKFLSSPTTLAAVRGAKTVWLARERERNAETQAEADRDHAAQRGALEGAMAGSGAALRIWEPSEGSKDVAEFNEAKGSPPSRGGPRNGSGQDGPKGTKCSNINV